MPRKYILTNTRIVYSGREIFQIQSTDTNELGGWVQGYHNLSQDGDCWVHDSAIVCDHAMVCGDALVCDQVVMTNYSRLFGSACLFGSVTLRDRAWVYDYAMIGGNVVVRDRSIISGTAIIVGDFNLSGDTLINAGTWDSSELDDLRNADGETKGAEIVRLFQDRFSKKIS